VVKGAGQLGRGVDDALLVLEDQELIRPEGIGPRTLAYDPTPLGRPGPSRRRVAAAADRGRDRGESARSGLVPT